MKKYRGIITILVCLVLVSLACSVAFDMAGEEDVRGSGRVVSEERTVSGVRRVNVANQGDLTIELGDEEKLTIEAEDNLQEYLLADMQGDKLVLRTRDNANLRSTEPIRYLLTVKQLEGLQVTSSGDIKAPELRADRFKIEISSSGNIDLEGLITDDLEVDISSSGEVTIAEGEAQTQDISISSSGSYQAEAVMSRRAQVRISSSGDARIWVTDELDVDISSSGNVYYRGDPHVDVRKTSSGDAIKSGD